MTPAITPDPTQQQDPQAPAPQDIAQGQPTPTPALTTPAPATPEDPKTHGWKAILEGALDGLKNHVKGAGKGLITGGIPGAVVGAVAPKMADNAMKFRQDEQQAHIKFANAEAASQVAEAHLRDAQLQQLPKELQLRQSELDQKTVQMYMTSGLNPVVVIPNTSEGAHAAADQLQKKFGSVPSLVYLHMGDKLVGFDPTDLASNSAVLNQVNNFQKVTGGPTYNQGSLRNAPNKTQLTQDAAHLFSPTFPGMDKAQGMISQYSGYISKVDMWPDSDPEKSTTLEKLKAAKSGLETAYKQRNNDQLAAAKARGEAAQNAKAIEVVDPKTNVAHFTSAGEAKAKGLTSASTAAKSEAKTAQLEDMQLGSKNMRDAVSKLSSGLTPATSVKLQAALRSGDEGYIHKTRDAIMASGLPEDQQNFVNALLNLQERALSLRSIGGQGQGSESQRNAVINLLPGVKDLGNRELMMKKLDAFDQQTGIYFKNIPKANVNTSATASTPAAKPAGATHTGVGSADKKKHWLDASGKDLGLAE